MRMTLPLTFLPKINNQENLPDKPKLNILHYTKGKYTTKDHENIWEHENIN